MLLKSLKINNFLAHENTEIEFAENGITVFIGDNGAGKSSILEAIYFALYGESLRSKSLSDIVRWGAKKASVELIFSRGNDEYKVHREIAVRGKSASTVSKVEKKEKGAFRLYYSKNINKELPKLTGLSKKTFTASVLVRQGDIEGLIDLTPSKREEVLKQLLDMQLYELLSNGYGNLRKEVEKEINAVISSLPAKKEIINQLNILEGEKEKVEKEKFKYELRLKEIEKKLKQYEETLKKFQKEKEERIKAFEEKKSLENLKKRLKQNIQEINEKIQLIERKEKDLKALEEKNALYQQKQKLLKELLKAQALKKDLDNLLEKEEKIIESENFVKNYAKVAEEYEKLKSKLQDINQQLKTLSQLQGEIKVLKSQIEEINKNLKESMENALNIVKQLKAIKKIYKPLELNPALIDTFIKDEEKLYKDYDQQLRNLREEYRLIDEQISNLKSQLEKINNLEGECPTCLRPIEEHSKDQVKEEIEHKIKKLEEKQKEIEFEGKTVKEKFEKTEEALKLLEEFKKWYDKHKEAQAQKQKIESKIQVINIKIKNLGKIEEEKNQIETFLKKEEANYRKYLNHKDFLSKVESEKKSISQKIKDIKDKLADIPDIDIKELEKEISELEKYVDEYNTLLKEISQKEELKSNLEKLQQEKENVEKSIIVLERKLNEKQDIEEKIEEIENRIKDIEDEKKKITDQYTPLVSKYGEISGKIDSLKEQLKFIEEKEKEAEAKKETLKKYQKLEEVFGSKGIQKNIRDKALYKLPVITETIFKAFGFDFTKVQLTDKFDLLLQVPTYERSDRFITASALSGGQRVALGLALRLALSYFLGGKSSFLILDEPTIHLDSQRKEELINVLLKLKEKNFIKQLIVVTHDREIEDAADQIYYVEKGKVKSVD